MTGARDAAEIFAARMRVVLELTEAVAAQRLAQSQVGGAALEIMRLEPDAGAPADPAALDAARARGAEAQAAMDAAAAQITALESALDHIDRELAIANSLDRKPDVL